MTELVKSEGERNKFVQYWSGFIEILTKLDSQQLNLDYDKKVFDTTQDLALYEDTDGVVLGGHGSETDKLAFFFFFFFLYRK